MVATAKNSKIFVKEVIRPGVYYKNGERWEFTDGDVRDFEQSLRRFHDETGFRVPLLREHVPKIDGQVEGVPFDPHAEEAAKLSRTVGRTVPGDPRTRINSRGGLDVAIEVLDENTARQLSSGLIEFVSPELRGAWSDGKGRRYEKLITHIALTHRPIITDQDRGFRQLSDSPRRRVVDSAVVQLSLCDLIGADNVPKTTKKKKVRLSPENRKLIDDLLVRLSDDEFPPKKDAEEGGENEPSVNPPSAVKPAVENPDMPKNDDVRIMEALLAHLAKRGIALPSDTDDENLADRLLTAVMSLNASDDLHASEEPDGDEGNNMAQEINPMTTAQMSATDQRKKLVERVRGCKSLPQSMRDDLLVRIGSVQFSDTGKEKVSPGSISVGELLEMYEQQSTQFSDGSPQQRLAERIKSMRGKQLLPAVADGLLARVASVQFSDDGKEIATSGVSISAMLDTLSSASSGIDKLLGSATQLSDAGGGGGGGSEGVPHPGGRAFTHGQSAGQVASDPATVQLSTEFLTRNGFTPRKENRLAINATEVSRAG